MVADIPPTADDLAPLPYELKVEPRAGAADDMVDVGRRYWTAVGIDEYDQIKWAEKTVDIETNASHVYIAAAIGVTAQATGMSCEKCGLTPWQPRTRTALQEAILDNGSPVDCIECNDRFQSLLEHELKPETVSRRQATRARREAKIKEKRRLQNQKEMERRVREEWDNRRRSVAHEIHPLTFNAEPDWCDLHDTVEVEGAVLACLRYAPTSTPIPPLREWATPLSPDREWSRKLMVAAWHKGFINVHPESDLAAFSWDVNFQEIVDATPDPFSWEIVLSHLPSPSTEAIYVPQILWYVPHGPSLGRAPELLDEHLSSELDLDYMSADRQQELLDLASKLIATETLRYFDFQLRLHNLPDVPENHRPRLREAAEKLGDNRALGDCFSLAWRSTRDAAATAQAKPQAPKANMTTYAVNQFEEKVQRALADPSWSVGGEKWHEDTRLPLSALTRLTFFNLLDSPIFQTSVPTIRATLPPPWKTHASDDRATTDNNCQIGGIDFTALTSEHQIDASIAQVTQELSLLLRAHDSGAVLSALRSSRTDLEEIREDEESGNDRSLSIHPAAAEQLANAFDGMYKAGSIVEAVTGDSRSGVLAACAAASAYAATLVSDQSDSPSVGTVAAQYLLNLAHDLFGDEDPPF